MSDKILSVISKSHKLFVDGCSKYETFTFLLENMLDITESEYGFIGEIIHEDVPFLRTYAITDIAWNNSLKKKYDKNIKNGMEFYSLDNLFGLVITKNKVIISNNPREDPRRSGVFKCPEGHPPLNCFVGIPFHHEEKLIGMVGLANKEGGYSNKFIEDVDPFIDTCSTLIANFKIKDDYKIIKKEKDKQLSQISHDLRTPLNAIFGYCQLLEIDIEDPESLSYVKMIKNSSSSLLNLVNSILNSSKESLTAKIESININKLIKKQIKIFMPVAKNNNIKMKFKSKIDFFIKGDYEMVNRIISNIINNSIKYNNNGGFVKISLKEKEYIELNIRDSGIGIPSEDMDKIFKPFFRSSNVLHLDGDGIGLDIVKKYMDILEGKIVVHSDQSGTNFKLFFLKSESRKTLYVEDNKTNRLLMGKIFKKYGSQIEYAENMDEAIEKINENDYALYFFDVGLPDGNGLDLVEIVDKKKVVIITADVSDEVYKRITDYNVKYLLKPFDIKDIVKYIQE